MYFRFIWEHLKGVRGWFICGMCLSVLKSALTIVNPYLAKLLVDDGIQGGQKDLVLPLVLGMIGVVLFAGIIQVIMIYCLENASQKMIINTRMSLFRNLQHQELSFFDRIRMGDVINRTTGDLEYLRHFVAWVSYQTVCTILTAIACIVILFYVSIPLTIAFMCIMPLISVTTFLYNKYVRPLYKNNRETRTLLNACANENIDGNRVVKAFSREEYEITKFNGLSENYKKATLKSAMANFKIAPVMTFFSQSITVVAIALGGYLAIKDPTFTVGNITLFTTIGGTLSGCIQMIPTLVNSYNQFNVSSQKVIEITEASPLIQNRHDAIALEPGERLKGAIEFQHVSFGYLKDTPVLKDLSFKIEPGETVAIMGPTGCGKTTLINLICRFYDVTKGSILLDGVDVRMRTLEDLHHSIGVATQDVFLFSDTIDGNIAFSDITMSEEKVKEYAKLSAADGFIREMEEGYETIIGERGVGISGGQRQRLALARALAYEPPILILDDTTSAVDMDTEKILQDSLAHLPFSCTKIIIAQRISSVRHANKIIILEDGHIQVGTHEELAASNRYYRDICELQDIANLPVFQGGSQQ